MASKFQIKLGSDWQDYSQDEDKILKRAYLAGYKHASCRLRGQTYEIDFGRMQQTNKESGKSREIRPPYNWKPPAAPIVPKGPTTCISVPDGGPGKTVQVPHPKIQGRFIAVDIPAAARVGQAMLVPVPPGGEPPSFDPVLPSGDPPALPPASAPPATPSAEGAREGAAGGADADGGAEKSGSYSTGAKVALGLGAGAVGGLVVAGVLLGEQVAEEGWDATIDGLGDAADDVAEGLDDAVDWFGDAAKDIGDSLMDLF
mmetsp:Transcript_86169/g.278415  ORF Transcript_86169/g.278415 Transcript_86169/m.278415 type:complete len:258 (+) Transcript_86169:97-870(+)